MPLLGLLVFLFVGAAVITAFSAIVLVLGMLLAHVFPVTTFEASLIVAIVAAVMLHWSLSGNPTYPVDADDEATVEDPMVIFSSLPLPPRRVRRQRKR